MVGWYSAHMACRRSVRQSCMQPAAVPLAVVGHPLVVEHEDTTLAHLGSSAEYLASLLGNHLSSVPWLIERPQNAPTADTFAAIGCAVQPAWMLELPMQ